MNKGSYFIGLLAVFILAQNGVSQGSGDGYLNPTCVSTLSDDFINLIQVVDVDKDGVPNILVGTSKNGILYNYIYKGADCTTDWEVLDNGGWSYNTPGDVKSFAVADLDGDGRNQIVMNSIESKREKSSTPTEYVYVIKDNAIDDWNFDKECGFTHSVDVADIDGTGVKNVVMGTKARKVCVIKDNPKDKTPILWSYDTGKYEVQYVKSMDINGDGKAETIAVSSKYLDAYIYCIDNMGGKMWEANIPKGLYTPALTSNVVEVAEMKPGKYSIIVGTYENGVESYDSKGAKEWSYKTGNLVSSVHTADVDGDGSREVLVGSGSNVIALDGRGGKKWSWGSDTPSTIYSISSADLDGDGKMEVAVGTSRYIHVLDNNGKLKGSWRYTVEIQGSSRAYEERDANAVAIRFSDLDLDGAVEVVVGWNWEQDTIMGNQYIGDVRVYEINRNYVPKPPTTTTIPQEVKDEIDAEMKAKQKAVETATTTTQKTRDMDELLDTPKPTTKGRGDDDGEGGLCCLPALPAILALGAAIIARTPLMITKED
ncbi:MAG: FG-GAP-like repeat-containing protein [Candidatus Altiarchaeota archaeon]